MTVEEVVKKHSKAINIRGSSIILRFESTHLYHPTDEYFYFRNNSFKNENDEELIEKYGENQVSEVGWMYEIEIIGPVLYMMVKDLKKPIPEFLYIYQDNLRNYKYIAVILKDSNDKADYFFKNKKNQFINKENKNLFTIYWNYLINVSNIYYDHHFSILIIEVEKPKRKK